MSKKRKLEVTKDVWTLISRQCEWPELSALRMVCTAARDTISLQSVHDKYKKWMLGTPDYVYHNIPRDTVVELASNITNICWLISQLVDKQSLGPTILRFARSHNYIK